MIKKVLPFVLIVLGAFLEVYYYAFRFTTDGIDWWLGIIIGSALTLLLMMSVYRKMNVIVVFLIMFSVISTSAGQTFSMIEKQKTESAALIDPEIQDLQKENKGLQEEIDSLTKQKNETVKSLEDAFEWKNTLQKTDDQIQRNREQIKTNRDKIDALQENKATGSTERNIYTFYQDLTKGLFKADFLKFFLHTVLSVFIALMAPVGIGMVEQKKPEVKKPELKKMDTDLWVSIMWAGEAVGKNRIPSEALLKNYCESKGISFSIEIHRKLLENAVKAGLLTADGMLLKNKERALSVMKSA